MATELTGPDGVPGSYLSGAGIGGVWDEVVVVGVDWWWAVEHINKAKPPQMHTQTSLSQIAVERSGGRGSRFQDGAQCVVRRGLSQGLCSAMLMLPWLELAKTKGGLGGPAELPGAWVGWRVGGVEGTSSSASATMCVHMTTVADSLSVISGWLISACSFTGGIIRWEPCRRCSAY